MVNNKDKRLEAFGRLLDVMDELRVKCPWDRVQTFESLRSSTIEETYELVDALLDHDMKNVKKELGDLLLHVVFYSKIASEEGAFDIADVANAECDKLIFRHPHVFGDVHADTPDEVKQNWEDLKLKEKEKEHEKKRVLSGVPRTLPSMVKAYRVSQRLLRLVSIGRVKRIFGKRFRKRLLKYRMPCSEETKPIKRRSSVICFCIGQCSTTVWRECGNGIGKMQ